MQTQDRATEGQEHPKQRRPRELATDVRTWARALIAYVIQGRETPPSGIPPLPKKEKKGTE